jgi:hypothetical protein
MAYMSPDRTLHHDKSWSFLVKEDSTSWWRGDGRTLLTIPSSDLVRITFTSHHSAYTGGLIGLGVGLAEGSVLALVNSHEEETFPIVFSATALGGILGILTGLLLSYEWSFELTN